MHNNIMSEYDEFMLKLKKIHDIKEPEYIAAELDPDIRALHQIYFIERAVTILPTISDDREVNRERYSRIRELDRPRYNIHAIIDKLRALPITKIIELYKTYGYSEFLTLLREKYNVKSQLGLVKRERPMIKRYWKNARPIDNLVYDLDVVKVTPNQNSGVTPEFIKQTRSIKSENEKPIPREVTKEAYPDILSPYNAALEKKIINKLIKCHAVAVRQPMDITQALLNSLNFYKYAMCDNFQQISDKVLIDIRKFMVDALYGVNPNIKNKRELFYGNANIIFDILKSIKMSIRVTSFNIQMEIPAKSRESRMELVGKIKFIIVKAINDSGIKMQKRGIEQVLCI